MACDGRCHSEPEYLLNDVARRQRRSAANVDLAGSGVIGLGSGDRSGLAP